ncbi:hypothetical protein ACRALDRAFT_1061574 [Sodiomyces alcalophilus JCM 7366]|uniref:uncharacterized protein n=1 Tax=Sodiomyces alcalophilus JCM 7366 TaxID=591952 RepID=UPI0039B45A93
MGAGRRMLFGALGLRNPKSKAEEDKLRKDLMKDVRPHANTRISSNTESAQVDATARDEHGEEDPEAWREKINYRAVECCDEGIELSEPPFPFVQRWDPQQQYGNYYHSGPNKNGRGGKRKRAQRNSTHFCQEQKNGSAAGKKQKVANDLDEPNTADEQHDETEYDDTVIRYDIADDAGEEGEGKEDGLVQSAFAGESQMSDIDDLPTLPPDLSTLPALQLGDAKPGMVITWKEWLLSSATSWQPQLADVVAVVVRVEDEDGTRLRLLLAKRDRGIDQNEKVYDEATGERVYGRFEVPDMDEDEENEVDDGYRDKEYSELNEPKIVQQPLRDYGAPSEEQGKKTRSETESIVPDTYQDQDLTGDGATGTNASGSPAICERVSEEADDDPWGRRGTGGDAADDTAASQQEDDPFRSSSPVERTDALTSSPSSAGPDDSSLSHQYEEMSMVVNSDEQGSRPGPGNHHVLTAFDDIDTGYRDGEPDDMEVEEDMAKQQQQQHGEDGDDEADTSELPPQGPRPGPGTTYDYIDTGHRDGVQGGSGVKEDTEQQQHQHDGDTHEADTELPSQNKGIVPSQASSTRSGRQPDPAFSIDLGNTSPMPFEETGEDIGSPDMTPKAEHLPKTPSRSSPGGLESSPFPSIDEVWATAPTSKSTQSPVKGGSLESVSKVRNNVGSQQDKEYEEAMRHGGEEGDDSPGPTKKQLFPNASQPAKSLSSSPPHSIKLELFSGTQGRTRSRQSSGFQIPPGSQVVTLSSGSSSEPEVFEDYAEDDIDGDYTEGSLPRGGGWVQKKNKRKQGTTRAVSMPAKQKTAGRRANSRKSMPAPPASQGAVASSRRRANSTGWEI